MRDVVGASVALEEVCVARKAVQLQAERLHAGIADDVPYFASRAAMADCYFFLLAVRRLIRAIDLAEAPSRPYVGHRLAEFRGRFPTLVPLRDVFEHFDDYLLGHGKLQRSGQVRNPGAAYHMSLGRDGLRLRIQIGHLTLDVSEIARWAIGMADEVTWVLEAERNRRRVRPVASA